MGTVLFKSSCNNWWVLMQAWIGVVDELTGNASAGKSRWRRVTQDASIVGRVHTNPINDLHTQCTRTGVP